VSACDRVTVSVLVAVPPAVVFQVFTEDIDQWWRRDALPRRWRHAGDHPPRAARGRPALRKLRLRHGHAGARDRAGLIWEPPARLVLEWRNANFAPAEKTEVDVSFAASASVTLVALVHRGWSALPPDHPARHGLETPAFVRMLGMWWGELATSLREHAACSVTLVE
jgi:uncharacterized protein YndB with AHSA1/START domain